MHIAGPCLNQSTHCVAILRSLPQWFGMEQSIVNYGIEIAQLPTFVAKCDAEIVGFLTLKVHTLYAAEIYVMGVRPEHHRRGIGKALIAESERYLHKQNVTIPA